MRSFLKVLLSLLFVPFVGCNDISEKKIAIAKISSEKNAVTKQCTVSQDFKDYWYAGNAEITSYTLQQERYGEIREGSAVTVFVTEDFVPNKLVKADYPSPDNIPVLKLNLTKKFLTGIYPYSIMTSTFNPVAEDAHAIKVSNSVQEWCGQTYLQLNNHKKFEIKGHSYFETEGDIDITLEKTWLEDELFNRIRINPEELPTGEITIFPSFESIRLRHNNIVAQKAFGALKQNEVQTTYTLTYPELQRELVIYFQNTFPFTIEKWEESALSRNGETMKTIATLKKQIKSDYWNKNTNIHLVLRDSLGL